MIQEQSLLSDELSDAVIADVRERMERAQAMRLQPSFIRRFFFGAFDLTSWPASPTPASIQPGQDNEPKKLCRHILALVEVADDDSTKVRYLYDPFTNREPEPSTAEHKRTLDWQTYWELAEPPMWPGIDESAG
ncbi:hypothetical protein [Candidatus Poriferisocius sp.]|uniref:hypothetical protein n=1 Tax=Candidatus Poriferisocius sp. TaxID=3101276 RepID=UPI003B01F043